MNTDSVLLMAQQLIASKSMRVLIRCLLMGFYNFTQNIKGEINWLITNICKL